MRNIEGILNELHKFACCAGNKKDALQCNFEYTALGNLP